MAQRVQSTKKKAASSRAKKAHPGKKAPNQPPVSSRKQELIGLVMIAVGLLVLFSLFSQSKATMIYAIHSLTYGLAGCLAFVVPMLLMILGGQQIFGKQHAFRLSTIVLYLLATLTILSLGQLGYVRTYGQDGYWRFIQSSYIIGSTAYGTGALGALLTYPLYRLLDVWGSAIALVSVLLIQLVFVTRLSVRDLTKRVGGHIAGQVEDLKKRQDERRQQRAKMQASAPPVGVPAPEQDFTPVDAPAKRPAKASVLEPIVSDGTAVVDEHRTMEGPLVSLLEQAEAQARDELHEEDEERALSEEAFLKRIRDFNQAPEQLLEPVDSAQATYETRVDNADIPIEPVAEAPLLPQAPSFTSERAGDKPPDEPAAAVPPAATIAPAAPPAIRVEAPAPPPYRYPPLALLALSEPKDNGNQKLSEENARKLEQTLESFGVAAKVLNITCGPSVTRYELQPAPGVKVSRIVGLTDDIALNLAALGVRVEAPIPGKAAIGIEIPNGTVGAILIRDVMASAEFAKHPSKVSCALGMDISGNRIIADLQKMPHLLIAGATGSGKSVCINTIITSILYKSSPKDVRMILIDPKVVELSVYNGIPHLLVPVVTDPKKAAGALNWAVAEMTRRYRLFAEQGVRDLKGFNASLSAEDEPLPQIVIIIDELADLMMVAPGEVEDAVCRLAQLARAAGMHLVIATQRPSVNVITGIIKANIPSRIAFAVASQVDSRTILDMGGAEKLLGRGDMLFHPSGSSKPLRVQGSFVSDSEVQAIVNYVKQDVAEVSYDEEILETMDAQAEGAESAAEPAGDVDELLREAIEISLESEQASISMLQRRLRVGYARAGRLIDEMTKRGFISQAEGAKPRNVLITREEFYRLFGDERR